MSDTRSARPPGSAGSAPPSALPPAPSSATPPVAESWFGALGVAGDAASNDEPGADHRAEDDSLRGRWFDNDQGPADERFVSREARRIVAAEDSAVRRILRVYLAARAALGATLVAWLLGIGVLSGRHSVEQLAIAAAYALLAGLYWAVPRWRPSLSQRFGARAWLASIGVDLLAFSALHLLEPFSGMNFVALLVLPVLMAGVLTSRLASLATAAGVALMLLLSAWRAYLGGAALASVLSQAGLTGIGFFVIVMLAGELAQRLAREERAARGSLELARQQARLNRLVIEEMVDGVMVVDRQGRVRVANPAALRLLAEHGEPPEPPFSLSGERGWLPLATMVDAAFDDGEWPEGGRDVMIWLPDGTPRTLRLRGRFTRRPAAYNAASEELCVLFAEDLRSVQDRSRNERLMAMGRVSAGIAHEIRNPLAAIAQANSLMAEDAQEPAQQQLLGIVTDNVARLKRIVDDVLEAAPGSSAASVTINATGDVARTCGEWARVNGLALGTGSRLRVLLSRDAMVVSFDAEHLRRVLVNLLDNALRHASDDPGAVAVMLDAVDEQRVRLSVASDGEPIARDVEPYLFEPFFSTRSRGAGLGLYICRQLCERHGGHIEYDRRPEGERHRNAFHVLMRRAVMASAS
jgi:two-component system, NtrC family, sensor histidine kinase PilS